MDSKFVVRKPPKAIAGTHSFSTLRPFRLGRLNKAGEDRGKRFAGFFGAGNKMSTTKRKTVDRRRFLGLLAAGGAACFGLDGKLFAAEDVPGEERTFSFGVIADVQYGEGDPQLSRYYRESLGKLEECVKRLNALKPDFIIQMGDLIQGNLATYDVVLPILEKLAMPCYHILGNHDGDVEPENRNKVVPQLGLDKLGDKKGYYDFGRAGWRFVVLNGNDISVLAHAPGTAPWLAAASLLRDLREKGARNAQDWNGALGKEQMKWLGRTLAKASRAGEKTIVLCHYPVYPAGSHTLWNDREVIRILESHRGVVAYFNGHQHEGDYALKKGIHYLTFRGMVETKQTAYALVEVYSNCLRVIGFGRESNRLLQTGQGQVRPSQTAR